MTAKRGRGARFELAAFARSPEHRRLLGDAQPDVIDALLNKGVPDDFLGGRFRAAAALAPLTVESRRLVWFGNQGPFVRIAVDVESGEVVELVDAAGTPPSLVNTSLRHFVDTATRMAGRFPFYSRDADLDERQKVADELAKIIKSIDGPALGPDRYWSTFIDDVAIGDFATDDLVPTEPD